MDRSPADLARYHRQMLLPGIGEEGQQRLAASSALLVGCGALGTVVADALARAGVGRLVIVDRDVVELTNLQRQVLFDERDAAEGAPKAEAAARRLRAVNSAIEITPIVADLSARNAGQLCRGVNVVVDGTDNFQTRYLLNDVCVKHGLPLVYGGVVGTTGMTMTIVPQRTPCLRCIFPDPPAPGTSPTCDTAGVLGSMVGVVASIQAAEALKILLGRNDLLRPVLSQFDIWNNQRRTVDLTDFDRAQCVCCNQRKFEFLDGAKSDSGTTSLCGSNAVQVLPTGEQQSVDLTALRGRLASHGEFAATGHLLRGRFAREQDRESGSPLELTVFCDGRAIIRGTQNPTLARTIYSKYVGA